MDKEETSEIKVISITENMSEEEKIKCAEDAAEILSLIYSLNSKKDIKEERDHLISISNSGRGAVFVLYLCKEPAGAAEVSLRYDYVEGAQTSPVGYLEGIAVKDGYRGRGFSGILLTECTRWAVDRGARELASDCNCDNKESISFHLKSDFENKGTLVHFIKKIHEE